MQPNAEPARCLTFMLQICPGSEGMNQPKNHHIITPVLAPLWSNVDLGLNDGATSSESVRNHAAGRAPTLRQTFRRNNGWLETGARAAWDCFFSR